MRHWIKCIWTASDTNTPVVHHMSSYRCTTVSYLFVSLCWDSITAVRRSTCCDRSRRGRDTKFLSYRGCRGSICLSKRFLSHLLWDQWCLTQLHQKSVKHVTWKQQARNKLPVGGQKYSFLVLIKYPGIDSRNPECHPLWKFKNFVQLVMLILCNCLCRLFLYCVTPYDKFIRLI